MHPYHQRRNSDARLSAIGEYLGDARGFTCLEFGALDGYFSARLADQYGAQCTAVDDSQHLAGTPGVTLINERLTPTQIRKLGTFDVVLCLSVLHHLPQWKATLSALLDAAPLVFVETANTGETLPKAKAHGSSASIHAAVEDAGGIELCRTPGYDASFDRPLWVIDNQPQPAPDVPAEDPDDLLES